jgi:V8-like Glu-specific endopeptidase
LFGLAGLVIGGGSAVASPAPGAAGNTTVTDSGLVPVFNPDTGAAGMATPDVAAPLINAYWTPARMAAATPVAETAGPADTDQKPEGTPQTFSDPVAGRLAASHALVSFTNTDGRVFFHDPADGKDHACSGSAINSNRKRLVLTAGHCVHDGGGGGWMQNWEFFPGFEFGAPGAAGGFTAFVLTAQSAWINSDDHGYDYAFVVTHIGQQGTRVVDTVGGNGLHVNPGRPFITFVGYPDNVANAQDQAFCQGQLSRKSITSADQQLNCNLGKGSSGGPWLLNFDNATGLGIAVSNTSYGINPDPQGPVFGPYYGTDTANLAIFAENLSPAN